MKNKLVNLLFKLIMKLSGKQFVYLDDHNSLTNQFNELTEEYNTYIDKTSHHEIINNILLKLNADLVSFIGELQVNTDLCITDDSRITHRATIIIPQRQFNINTDAKDTLDFLLDINTVLKESKDVIEHLSKLNLINNNLEEEI